MGLLVVERGLLGTGPSSPPKLADDSTRGGWAVTGRSTRYMVIRPPSQSAWGEPRGTALTPFCCTKA